VKGLNISTVILAVGTVLLCAAVGCLVYLFILLTRALKTYIRSKQVRREMSEAAKSLGEVLKTHRTQQKMTQEFVAEALGVSRQAVSKWESGLSDPSTSNLIALGKLWKIPPEELLSQARK